MQNETLAYVIADLRDRAEVGYSKYGCHLEDSPDNMLQHMYEELLDAAMYVKAQLIKQKKEKELNQRLPLDLGDYL